MSQTKAGALKTRAKNLAKDPDYYIKLGHKGGTAPHSTKQGFAVMPKEKHLEASARGGRNGKRA